MKWNKFFIPLFAFSSITFGFADTMVMPEEEDMPTIKVVDQEKSVIQLKRKGTNFFMSGDVRAKWTRRQRKTSFFGASDTGSFNGFGSGTGRASNFYESRLNLTTSFDADRSWAQAKLEFKNTGFSSFALRRAYIGYDLLRKGEQELYTEIGLQGMSDLFDSQVQFDFPFLGILLGYDYNFPCWGHFYIHGGPFVVNNVVNHYAWVAETGITEFAQTGLYVKYSFIDWNKNGVDQVGISHSPQYRYANSQVILGYVFKPKRISIPARVFTGFVHNHIAKATRSSAGKKQPNAFYVGFDIGKLEKAGDWDITGAFEYVQLNSVPQNDLAGVGRGFLAGSAPFVQVDPTNPAFYQPIINPDDANPDTFEGNTNYKGYTITGIYNVTSNLAWRTDFKQSWQLNKRIGGHNYYTDLAMTLIYSF